MIGIFKSETMTKKKERKMQDLFENIVIKRTFQMPNSETFNIPAIKDFIQNNIKKEWYIADPFARNNKIANITNDIDVDTEAFFHMDALDFLKSLHTNSIDCVLYDPPYSPRQIKEVYTRLDKSVSWTDTNASFWSNQKKEISRIVKRGGVVFSFGWNSNGIGKKYGFAMRKILLVNHGGQHNDTICTLEEKVNDYNET